MHLNIPLRVVRRTIHFILTLAICGLATPQVRAEFVHPGVAHSAGSIALVKAKIEANEQPWAKAWHELSESRYAQLDWQPEPSADVERGASNNPDIGSSEFSGDAAAAYVHAICWTMTGNAEHAKKSAEILDAWSSTLESIGNHDARLLVGMSSYKFTVAAELLKHTWDGWPVEQQNRFARMAREIWYPIIVDFYPSANGNWDASMLQTMMAMGVFLDDQVMFDRAKEYFIRGKGNGAIGMYFNESGQCQETGRDQAHTQMGLDYLSATCETAWIQGIDLYSELDDRLLAGFEYTAKYNLGNDVPYEPYRSFEGRYHYKKISDNSRGRLRPMYERVFNHYHNRKGLDAPFTKQAAENLRGNRSSSGSETEGRSNRGRDREGRSRGRRRRDRTDAALDTLMYAQQPATFATNETATTLSP